MIDFNLLRTVFPEKLQAKRWAGFIQESPTPSTPIVSQQDVERGFLDRYFVRPVNDKSFVVEIDEIQYEKFKGNPRFLTTKIKWKIIGKQDDEVTSSGVILRGVRDYNIQQVSKADLVFKVLGRYITNYTEYWVSES